jgi:Cdc6-like AAA superfamily ATPase
MCAKEDEQWRGCIPDASLFMSVAPHAIARSTQHAALRALLTSPAASAVFVTGNTATGKTHVLRSVLAAVQSQIRAAYVDCIEAYSARVLFESILNQLAGWSPNEENGFASMCRCDRYAEIALVSQVPRLIMIDRSLHEFAARMTELTATQSNKRTVIVLDRADRLRALPTPILSFFLRMHELV